MNWKDRFSKPKPGDKIIILKKFNSHEKGKYYTLLEQYIKDGKWLKDGSDQMDNKENWWITKETSGFGIEDINFRVDNR